MVFSVGNYALEVARGAAKYSNLGTLIKEPRPSIWGQKAVSLLHARNLCS